ncbi:glycosyltransferase [Marivirga arenosa]|uniref:Glycosyltransferase n=1 Tax=Marivirga arenosa TaxID=3059076 RepID=A0AA51ZUQ3_9BACT|nr:glycosyltransferase [Marivirga sp. BKB1-2]WNB16844.1 glycosyltransferase [Marivirga sp. BKB1-2]
MSDLYFDRYAYPKRFIKSESRPGTFIRVVIPVFNEPDIRPTLESLAQCNPTKKGVEVILVINHAENASETIKENSRKTVDQINKFIIQNTSDLEIQIIEAFDLPKKKAGVGLARKIGMDEAAYRFNSINQDGVILCFDADSLCEKNYLCEIENHFLKYPDCNAASIHYEHPETNEDGNLNEPIILYELHLRYYIQALKYTDYPFAYHTIGSSMAARSSVYQKQGGMNQRKAGEDFYFLHKIIPLGNFHTITSTKVIPSARISDRVPFGTGRAMQEHQNNTKDLNLTYDFECFKIIKAFMNEINIKSNISDFYSTIKSFLIENGLETELNKIQSQSKNQTHFKQRFFEWFNGFKMLKLVHYLRDNQFHEKLLTAQATALLVELGYEINQNPTALELLKIYRQLDIDSGN